MSGIGHLILVLWLMIGGSFDSDPLPLESVDVSVISGEEFAALIAPPAPDAVTETPAPAPPEPETAPAVSPRPQRLSQELRATTKRI